MTSFIDSEPCVIVGDEAVSKTAIEEDVFLLIHTFAKEKERTFATFAKIWKEMDFSLIHFGCPDQNGRPYFMQAINEAIIEHFQYTNPAVRLGVMFALFLIYFSQPDIWPRQQIRMTIKTWPPICQFAGECSKDRTLADGYIAFIKLYADHAFAFYALPTQSYSNISDMATHNQLDSLYGFLKEIRQLHWNRNVSNYLDESKLDDLENLTKMYSDAKKELFKTRHATLAAQKLMKDLANIHETNATHLQRVLQSSSLGSSEDFASAERELVQRYETARFNSVLKQNLKAINDTTSSAVREGYN